MEIFNGVMTAILIVLFLAIWAWAWSAKNKDNFNQMSSLPLEDEIIGGAEVKDE